MDWIDIRYKSSTYKAQSWFKNQIIPICLEHRYAKSSQGNFFSKKKMNLKKNQNTKTQSNFLKLNPAMFMKAQKKIEQKLL